MISATNLAKVGTSTVVFVVYDGLQLLDLAGPLDVFSAANSQLAKRAYRTVVASARGGLIRTASGLEISTVALSSVRGPIDTLVVTGGPGTTEAVADPVLRAAILRLAKGAGRVTSVCSGAFVLATAGLLDGRRATTHWEVCDLLASRYPTTTVEPDSIYVIDGNVWTSAGVTAGIDLALAMVSADHGAELARHVAQRLVVYMQRAGGQLQFSARLAESMAVADASPITQLVGWIPDHLDSDMSVRGLAARVNMSERNFARVFLRDVGCTPATHVENLRIEEARRILELSSQPVAHVAASCGFGTVETMHRVFRRRLGSTPASHRRHFRHA